MHKTATSLLEFPFSVKLKLVHADLMRFANSAKVSGEMIGRTLLHYRILEKIAEGGQGAVYKALDTRLRRNVVVKVLPEDLTLRAANLKRFEREARLASSLDHPNICTIFDLNEAAGVHFIVMQLITGRARVGGGPSIGTTQRPFDQPASGRRAFGGPRSWCDSPRHQSE